MQPSSRRPALALAPAIVAALLLVACTPPRPRSVAVTSHADQDRILGARTVVLEGTAEGVDRVAARLDGAEVAQADVVEGAFAVPVLLDDNHNAVRVETIDGLVGDDLELVYPWVDLATFRPLDVVVGQSDPTAFASGLSASLLGSSTDGVPLHVGGILYVPDPVNHRVLGFIGLPDDHGADADFVLGQASFDANTRNDDDQDGVAAAPSARTLYCPGGVASDGVRLFVADTCNSRILIYESLPTTSFASADVVVGQHAMDEAKAGTCDIDHPFDLPERVAVGGGRLVVADPPNNRVLIWNRIPTEHGVPPDVVLGQGGPGATCEANDDDQDGNPDAQPSARTLHAPKDAWTDGERLLVADTKNRRVLLWQTFPTEHFAPADLVIGQLTMDVVDAGTGASMFDDAEGVASNGNQIVVADYYNRRLLVFDAFPTSSFPTADHVLGQATFTNTATNDDDQDGVPDPTPSTRTVGGSFGAWMGEGVLLVNDYENNRVAVFVD